MIKLDGGGGRGRLIARELGRVEKRGEQTDRREESTVKKGKSKRKRFQRTVRQMKV
jgi:hypothetical protein